MRSREIVLSELRSAVEEERQSTLRVLHLLREVERDKHYLEMGYPSLFEFATQELKYSPGAAQRRIQAMRLLKSLPEIEEKIEDGSLSLCVASKTQGFFRQEDQRRREAGQPKLELAAKKEIVQSMLGASSRECERRLAEISPEAAHPKERAQPLAHGKTLIQFVAGEELMEKLEKLKSLMAHQNFDGRYDRLIELMADLALKKLEPKKSKSDQKPLLPTSAVKERTRYITVEVERFVRKRDGNQCTFVDSKSGRRCSSRHDLQLDHHLVPFAWGGPNTPENLTLRCGAHNRLMAEKLGLLGYGDAGA